MWVRVDDTNHTRYYFVPSGNVLLEEHTAKVYVYLDNNYWGSESDGKTVYKEKRVWGNASVSKLEPVRQSPRSPIPWVPTHYRGKDSRGRFNLRSRAEKAESVVVTTDSFKNSFSRLHQEGGTVVVRSGQEVNDYATPDGMELKAERRGQFRVFAPPARAPASPPPACTGRVPKRPLEAPPENGKTTDWVNLTNRVSSRTRDIAQSTAMMGWSARQHAEQMRRSYPGGEALCPIPNRADWEWLHLMAASLEGKTRDHNLVAGRRDTNTEMAVVERYLAEAASRLPNGQTIEYRVTAELFPGSHVAKVIRLQARFRGGRQWLNWKLDALNPRCLHRATFDALMLAVRRESGVFLDTTLPGPLQVNRMPPVSPPTTPQTHPDQWPPLSPAPPATGRSVPGAPSPFGTPWTGRSLPGAPSPSGTAGRGGAASGLPHAPTTQVLRGSSVPGARGADLVPRQLFPPGRSRGKHPK